MQKRSQEYLTNHREYSRWIMWRCLIDKDTAEWIMHDPSMQARIARLRGGKTDNANS